MDGLTQTVDRLREEIDMFETQCSAQLEETKAAQKSLSEATTEIEVSINNNIIKCVFVCDTGMLQRFTQVLSYSI